jgi:AraC-like DNA-binding protein
MSAFLCGRTVELKKAHLAFQVNKKHKQAYEKVFGRVLFNAPENKLVFSKAVAELEVITQNEHLYSHMLQFCEEKLKEISVRNTYADKIKKLLTQKNSFYLPKLEEVSAMLHFSSRTLQRKLKEENVQYQQIVEEHQMGHAKNLLKQKDVPIKEIAYLLGYTNTESFTRAFKRNTGLSPKKYGDEV